MQKMIPNDIGMSTAAIVVTAQISRATRPYFTDLRRLLREYEHMSPAKKRNDQDMLALHTSSKGGLNQPRSTPASSTRS